MTFSSCSCTYASAPLSLAKQAAGGPSELARLLTAAGYPIKPSAIRAWVCFPRRRAAGIARVLGVPVGELLTEQQRKRI